MLTYYSLYTMVCIKYLNDMPLWRIQYKFPGIIMKAEKESARDFHHLHSILCHHIMPLKFSRICNFLSNSEYFCLLTCCWLRLLSVHHFSRNIVILSDEKNSKNEEMKVIINLHSMDQFVMQTTDTCLTSCVALDRRGGRVGIIYEKLKFSFSSCHSQIKIFIWIV